MNGGEYIEQLKAAGTFDQARTIVLAGCLCPACWGTRVLDDWYIDQDSQTQVHQDVECPLCAPEPRPCDDARNAALDRMGGAGSPF